MFKKNSLSLILLIISNFSYGQLKHTVLYDNGKIKEEGQFDTNGKKTGLWVDYWKNGFTSNTGYYVEDMLSGKWKQYHETNGQLWYEKEYDENERLTNEFKSYWDNGNLKSIGLYNKGEMIGEWKLFHENGYLYEIGTYINDKKDGKFISYYDNGKLIQHENYNHGIKIGEWISYHENGNLEDMKRANFLGK